MFLVIQGSAGNAEASDALAVELVTRFRVVTYDRRGLSRSTPFSPDTYGIDMHADDAMRILAALSPGQPAVVFGGGIGGLIGLDLVARWPGMIRLLIVHEPPCFRLLEGAEREEAIRGHEEVRQVFREAGLPAAMRLMIARDGIDVNDREPEVQIPGAAPPYNPRDAQRFADLQHFLTWDVPAVTRYEPDLPALQAAAGRVLPAVGVSPSPAPPRACALFLAKALGVPLAEFPGGHTGYILRPKAFAARLLEVCAPQS